MEAGRTGAKLPVHPLQTQSGGTLEMDVPDSDPLRAQPVCPAALVDHVHVQIAVGRRLQLLSLGIAQRCPARWGVPPSLPPRAGPRRPVCCHRRCRRCCCSSAVRSKAVCLKLGTVCLWGGSLARSLQLSHLCWHKAAAGPLHTSCPQSPAWAPCPQLPGAASCLMSSSALAVTFLPVV